MTAMRRRIVLGVLGLVAMLGACAHPPLGQASLSVPIRAMTFNIRLDLASDGANAWAFRKDIAAQTIAYLDPDVLGLQEVLLDQKRDLEAALPGFTFAGVARDNGREEGEFSPLAWNTSRFDAEESGTFWLSPTPVVPGKGWDAAYPRIATWALLRDRRTGERIRVLNTHFDHVGKVARRESAAQIATWAMRHRAAGEAVIVMGDFNADPSTEPMRILADPEGSGLVDARARSLTTPFGPAGTFTGFDIARNAAAPIDHILASDRFRVLRHATITQHWGGRLPSDHYPVVADLELPAG